MALAEQLRGLLADHLGVDEEEITKDAKIVDDLGADSLDCVEITMALEETYAIEISDEDAEMLSTFSDLLSYMETRVPARKES